MFGGNMPDNDEFTLSLLTNKEVLAVNQHSTGNRQLFSKEGKIAWTASDPKTGDKYLALFNTNDSKGAKEDAAEIAVDLKQIGIKGNCFVKDLWTGKKVGKFNGEFVPVVKCHASRLYRISVKK